MITEKNILGMIPVGKLYTRIGINPIKIIIYMIINQLRQTDDL